MYLSLLSQGWRMSDIDDLDLFIYVDLLRRKKDKPEETTTIDQIEW